MSEVRQRASMPYPMWRAGFGWGTDVSLANDLSEEEQQSAYKRYRTLFPDCKRVQIRFPSEIINELKICGIAGL